MYNYLKSYKTSKKLAQLFCGCNAAQPYVFACFF